MSVELTRTGLGAKMHLNAPCACCTCCGEKLWPPYMVWRGTTDIFICGGCAESVKDGFMADLIHLSAVKQFERLQPSAGFTLVRTSVKTLEAADRAWDQAHSGTNVTKIK
jgi:hypothetical protein